MAETGGRRTAEKTGASKARTAALRKKRRRKKVIQVWIRRGIAALVLLLVLAGLFFGIRGLIRLFGGGGAPSPYGLPDYIQEDYLTVNPYSRPGIKLPGGVKGIVVHYVANPGSTAENNRNYFEGLKDSGDTYASSNFIIGLEGEVLACVPIDEVAYASNQANDYTLSIECCHPDATGEFTQETYDSLVRLTAYLCHRFGLSSEDVIRHYDVTGKECPLYYVEHEDAWEAFRQEVQAAADALAAEEAETAGGEDGSGTESQTAESPAESAGEEASAAAGETGGEGSGETGAASGETTAPSGEENSSVA